MVNVLWVLENKAASQDRGYAACPSLARPTVSAWFCPLDVFCAGCGVPEPCVLSVSIVISWRLLWFLLCDGLQCLSCRIFLGSCDFPALRSVCLCPVGCTSPSTCVRAAALSCFRQPRRGSALPMSRSCSLRRVSRAERAARSCSLSRSWRAFPSAGKVSPSPVLV